MFMVFLRGRLLVPSPYPIRYETPSRFSGGLFEIFDLGLALCGVLFIFSQL